MERLVIITGASRGIGAEIAFEADRRFKDANTKFLLIARDEKSLKDVKGKLSAPNNASILKIDFSKEAKVDEYIELLKTSLSESSLKPKELYVFYNHGTLKLGSVEEVAASSHQELVINVSSVWVFLASIRALFPIDSVPKQFHINISSLMATKTTAYMSIYCASRAARASLFRSLAIEEPKLRVLNYQPGPVYTDMLKQIYEGKIQLYETYFKDYEDGKMLSANVTVNRLFDLIEKNGFESGETIDFYDDK